MATISRMSRNIRHRTVVFLVRSSEVVTAAPVSENPRFGSPRASSQVSDYERRRRDSLCLSSLILRNLLIFCFAQFAKLVQNANFGSFDLQVRYSSPHR